MLKNAWHILLAIAGLLFLPQKHWEFWFIDRPQDWYGEFHLRGDNNIYVISKNSYKKIIEPNLTQAIGLAADPIQKELTPVSKISAIPAEHYAIFEVISGHVVEKRSARIKDGATFEPSPLKIITVAEDEVSILISIAVILLFSVLSFIIGAYIFEEISIDRDESTSNSKP